MADSAKRSSKRPTSFRLSPIAREKLRILSDGYGCTRTTVLELAIDRLYRSEVLSTIGGEEPEKVKELP